MNESIYNLIPRPQEVPQRPPIYRSTHNGKVEAGTMEMGVSKREAATFGRPNGSNAPPPNDFLRSHAKEPCLPEPAAPSRTKMTRKDPVPLRTEKPVMGLVSGKNFVTANAVENILAQPKNVPVEPPNYLTRPGYGKAPGYLAKNKEKVEAERQQVEEYFRMREETVSSHVKQMDDAERRELVKHLKLKWSSVNTAYQKMTFTLDTPAKQKRKEEYERQLAEIEADIKQLERGDVILVVDE